MTDYTNDLLKRLTSAIDALNAATASATDIGIPNSPLMPFFRMGEPLIIPVSPTSGIKPYPETGTLTLPPNVTTFRAINPNPFAVRLRGTRAGQPFNAVTSATGWLFLPGSVEVYTTLNPAQLSAMSVDGPFAATDPAQKAGVGVLELQYGTGA
jgi:hypothetical protein